MATIYSVLRCQITTCMDQVWPPECVLYRQRNMLSERRVGDGQGCVRTRHEDISLARSLKRERERERERDGFYSFRTTSNGRPVGGQATNYSSIARSSRFPENGSTYDNSDYSIGKLVKWSLDMCIS